MATTLHSFIDIFDTTFGEGPEAVQLKKIIIPIIQRDYAQGRKGSDVTRVRGRFLESLYKAVTEKPITLDFVYGDIDDEGNISMNTLEKIPNSIHLGKLKRSILKKWDILFSIAGTIGRVATVDSRLDNSNANQAIAFIRLKEVEKMFVFILHLLKSENIQNEIKANVVQAVQANASLGTIKSLKYTLPTDNIIKKFNRIIYPIYNKQTNIRIESEQLTQLRDTLLPKLMSGEIRVPLEDGDILWNLDQENLA